MNTRSSLEFESLLDTAMPTAQQFPDQIPVARQLHSWSQYPLASNNVLPAFGNSDRPSHPK